MPLPTFVQAAAARQQVAHPDRASISQVQAHRTSSAIGSGLDHCRTVDEETVRCGSLSTHSGLVPDMALTRSYSAPGPAPISEPIPPCLWMRTMGRCLGPTRLSGHCEPEALTGPGGRRRWRSGPRGHDIDVGQVNAGLVSDAEQTYNGLVTKTAKVTWLRFCRRWAARDVAKSRRTDALWGGSPPARCPSGRLGRHDRVRRVDDRRPDSCPCARHELLGLARAALTQAQTRSVRMAAVDRERHPLWQRHLR